MSIIQNELRLSHTTLLFWLQHLTKYVCTMNKDVKERFWSCFSCSCFLIVFGAWCFQKYVWPAAAMRLLRSYMKKNDAKTRDRTGDFQIFGLTLSQLSYRGLDLWTWPYAASL